MIERVERRMSAYLADMDERVKELYAQLSGGKRLRAKLILYIAGEEERSVDLAAIVELIHAASLLHDDVIDDAELRRGSASINALYGDKSAIMLGDILYSTGFAGLVRFPLPVATSLAEAVAALSEGELLDVSLSERFNTDVERYFEMIYKKTAVLIEATARSAAHLAGKSEEAFALYGKNIGLAFQVIDDLLDITADETQLGKPTMHDLEEGKTTLPYIFLFQRLSSDERRHLKSLFKKRLDEKERAWILDRMRRTGALEQTMTLAKELGKEALEAIAHEKNEKLESIVRAMIEREY